MAISVSNMTGYQSSAPPWHTLRYAIRISGSDDSVPDESLLLETIETMGETGGLSCWRERMSEGEGEKMMTQRVRY